jgi:hypothetical protein
MYKPGEAVSDVRDVRDFCATCSARKRGNTRAGRVEKPLLARSIIHA